MGASLTCHILGLTSACKRRLTAAPGTEKGQIYFLFLSGRHATISPNKGSELTAHSVGFLAVPEFVSCGPPLKPGVRLYPSRTHLQGG